MQSAETEEWRQLPEGLAHFCTFLADVSGTAVRRRFDRLFIRALLLLALLILSLTAFLSLCERWNDDKD
jgi:hypothetical protein